MYRITIDVRPTSPSWPQTPDKAHLAEQFGQVLCDKTLFNCNATLVSAELIEDTPAPGRKD